MKNLKVKTLTFLLVSAILLGNLLTFFAVEEVGAIGCSSYCIQESTFVQSECHQQDSHRDCDGNECEEHESCLQHFFQHHDHIDTKTFFLTQDAVRKKITPHKGAQIKNSGISPELPPPKR